MRPQGVPVINDPCMESRKRNCAWYLFARKNRLECTVKVPCLTRNKSVCSSSFSLRFIYVELGDLFVNWRKRKISNVIEEVFSVRGFKRKFQ